MPISGMGKQARSHRWAWPAFALLLVTGLHLLSILGLLGGWFSWTSPSAEPTPVSLSVRIIEAPRPPPPPTPPPPTPPPPAPAPTLPAAPPPEAPPVADVPLTPDSPDAETASDLAPTDSASRSPRARLPASEQLPKAGRLAVEAFWGEYSLGDEPLGRGEIEIQFPAADRYRISLTARAVRWLSVLVTGEVRFLSEGRLDETGLLPERFSQVTPRGGASESRFDLARGKAQLKPDGPELDMPPGVQDRLSVVFQIALWGQSRPEGLQPGDALEVPLAGRSDVRKLRFIVGDREDLVLPGGILVSALRIASDPFEFKRQGQIEMWLDPADRFFPARILYREPSGRALDFLAIRPVF